MKKRVVLIFLSLTIILLGIIWFTRKETLIIHEPKEIIVYSNTGMKSLTKKDLDFKTLVELINKRFKKSNNIKIAASPNYTNYLYKDKASFQCLEFIYDKENTLSLKCNKDNPYKYKKLFFTIKAEGTKDYCDYMVYGDEDYTNAITGISIDESIMKNLLKVMNK